MFLFFFTLLFIHASVSQNYCNETFPSTTFSITGVTCTDIYDSNAIAATSSTSYFFVQNGTNWEIQHTESEGALACSSAFNWAAFQVDTLNFKLYYYNATTGWNFTQQITMFYPISQFDLYYNISTGMTLIIGTATFNFGQGKAYIYQLFDSIFNYVTEITVNGTSNFGYAVSVGNGFAIISSDLQLSQGTVYLYGMIFPETNDTFPFWTLVGSITIVQPLFGSWIDISSEVAIIGYTNGFSIYQINNLTSVVFLQDVVSTTTYGFVFQNNILVDNIARAYYRFGDLWLNVYDTYSGSFSGPLNYNFWGVCTIFSGSGSQLSFFCTDELNECNMCNRCTNPGGVDVITDVAGNVMNISLVNSNPNCSSVALMMQFPSCIGLSNIGLSGCNNESYFTFPSFTTINSTDCNPFDYVNIAMLCVPDTTCTTTLTVTGREMLSGYSDVLVVGDGSCSSNNVSSYGGCNPYISPNSTVISNSGSSYSDYINYYIFTYTIITEFIIPFGDDCANVSSITGCSATWETVDCSSGCPSCGTLTFERYINVSIVVSSYGGGAYDCNLIVRFDRNMTIANGNVTADGACFFAKYPFNCTIPTFTTGMSPTTNKLTTARLTTGRVSHFTTNAFTTSQVTAVISTTSAITTSHITTKGLTTHALSTGELTSYALTTSPLTTGITTSPLSTGVYVTTDSKVKYVIEPEIVAIAIIPSLGVLITIFLGIYFACKLGSPRMRSNRKPERINITLKEN
jgi:exosortase/archaeosortase